MANWAVEVGGSVGVGHGAGGEQEELAEVTLVQREFADGLAGQLFATGALLVCNDDGRKRQNLRW